MTPQTGAPTEEKDPWETGTGMADNFDGYLTEVFFGTDERYNAEAVLFCATLVGKDGDEITTIKYSVGDGWVANEAGTEIAHPTKTQINQSSRFGYFIDRIAKPAEEKAPKDSRLVSPSGEDKGLGLGGLLRKRGAGTPFAASTFEGLGFHWKLHKGATLGKDDKGDVIWKDVLYPVKYLGEYKGGSATAATPATPKMSVPTVGAAAATASSSNGADVEIPGAIRKKLTLLALENDTKTFVQKAARDRDVLGLPDAVTEHIFDSSAEGFWAKVQG